MRVRANLGRPGRAFGASGSGSALAPLLTHAQDDVGAAAALLLLLAGASPAPRDSNTSVARPAAARRLGLPLLLVRLLLCRAPQIGRRLGLPPPYLATSNDGRRLLNLSLATRPRLDRAQGLPRRERPGPSQPVLRRPPSVSVRCASHLVGLVHLRSTCPWELVICLPPARSTIRFLPGVERVSGANGTRSWVVGGRAPPALLAVGWPPWRVRLRVAGCPPSPCSTQAAMPRPPWTAPSPSPLPAPQQAARPATPSARAAPTPSG